MTKRKKIGKTIQLKFTQKTTKNFKLNQEDIIKPDRFLKPVRFIFGLGVIKNEFLITTGRGKLNVGG